jgi:UDP-3-O-[3-hydroxymyristoyl] glucosamine N-acyltransferase
VTAAATRRLSAQEIAALTGGRVIAPAPDGEGTGGDQTIAGIAALDRAAPGDLSFLASARYLQYYQRTRATIVLIKPEFERAPCAAIRVVVANPHGALQTLIPLLYPQPVWEPGVHATAVIGRGATWEDPIRIGPNVVIGEAVRIGRNARIDAGCVVGDGVVIGDDAQLFPNVVCYPGTVLGHRVMLHAGVRLGSDGFGYVTGKPGETHRKIPHVGRCLLGDDVEIGANSTVDRGSVDDTVIGDGTKIDNLVQVGHNVRIGARCLIMAQTGIAGSTRIEDDCIISGQVGLAGHFTVGRAARIAAQAGVWGDVKPGASVSGYPAREHRDQLRAAAALNRLVKMVDDLEDLVSRKPPTP